MCIQRIRNNELGWNSFRIDVYGLYGGITRIIFMLVGKSGGLINDTRKETDLAYAGRYSE